MSSGMVERMRHKTEQEKWNNVKVVQADILGESEVTQQLQNDGFDLIVSCYTFHHLQDVTAIGQALMKYLKPEGYFCMIGWSSSHSSLLSEAAKASIRTRWILKGLSIRFL